MPLQPRDPETDGGVHTQREKRRGGKGAKGKSLRYVDVRTYDIERPPPLPPHGVSAARIAVASVLTARIVAALRHCCGGAPRPGAARRGVAAHPRRGPLLPLCARKKKVVKKMAVVTLRPSFPDAPPSSSRRRRKPAPFFRREEKPPSFSLYFTTQTTHCTYSASEKEVSPLPLAKAAPSSHPSIHCVSEGENVRSTLLRNSVYVGVV